MIIGLTGRKQSGKDTAAQALIEKDFMQVAFAAPMKIMIATLLEYQGVPEEVIMEMLHGSLKEVPTVYLGGQTPRHALQTLGTEWGRNQMGKDFWAAIGVNVAEGAPRAVITDVRFENEAALIRARGGEIWKIERPDRPTSDFDNHASEAEIDTLVVDRVIVNSGTIETLHVSVGEMLDVQ